MSDYVPHATTSKVGKRISTRSNIPGFSQKAWTSFVNSLTDDESHVLGFHFASDFTSMLHDCDESDGKEFCLGCSIGYKMRHSGYNRDHLKDDLRRIHASIESFDLSEPNSHPPSPRLVGIETNPGPPKGTVIKIVKSKKKNNKTVKKTTTLRRGPSSQSSSSSVRPYRFQRNPSVVDYQRSLSNPFFAPPPKLGYDCYVPTQKLTGFIDQPAVPLGASITGCVVWTDFSTSRILSSCAFTNAQYNTAISTITYADNFATNYVTINSASQSGRLISGALRVKIRASSTSLPGLLGVVYVPLESLTNLVSLTPNQIMALPGYRSCTAVDQNTIGGEVQYRPADSSAYEFIPAYTSVGGFSSSVTKYIGVFVASQWTAANFGVEAVTICHYESLGGFDAASDADDEPSLASAGVTQDSMGYVISTTPTNTLLSLTALEALDAASSHLTRMRGMRSFPGAINALVRGAIGSDNDSIGASSTGGFIGLPSVRTSNEIRQNHEPEYSIIGTPIRR